MIEISDFMRLLLEWNGRRFIGIFSIWQGEDPIQRHHRNADITFCKKSQDKGCIDNLINQQFKSECSYMTEELLQQQNSLVNVNQHLEGKMKLWDHQITEIFFVLQSYQHNLIPSSLHISKNMATNAKDSVSYLSSTICDEFIDILGRNVLDHIMTEIQEVKYFSICLD